MKDGLSNYTQAMALLLTGGTFIIVAAFLLLRAPDIANTLKTIGNAVCGAALMMLYQNRAEPPRVFVGGERLSDKPAPKEGTASGG